MLAGFGRRAWAQLVDNATRYFPLTTPIRIPVGDVTVPWHPITFTAEAMAPATSTTASRRVLISGVLFKKGSHSGSNDLSALCLTCPHEQCKVDLITDPARLTGMTAATPTGPVFECACHLSVFDAADEGARIAGETPRGLYRFRIGGINRDMVEITDIEEVALFEV